MALVLKSDKPILSNTNTFNTLDLLTASELAQLYIDRVAADGGTISDLDYLNRICNFLATNKLASKVHTIASASLGLKVAGNNDVSKMYNLINDYDLKLVQLNATMDIIDNPAKPKFVAKTSGNRAQVWQGSSTTANSSTSLGNVFIQDQQYLSTNECVSVSIVAEMTGVDSFSGLSIFSFANSDNKTRYNRVFHGTSNYTSDTALGNITAYMSDARSDEDDSQQEYVIYASRGTTSGAAIKKDGVLHFFTGKDANARVAVSNKLASNSDVYTNTLNNSTAAKTKQFKEKRNFNLGTSYHPTTNRFSNLKFYDVFVFRDLNDFNQSLLVRDFIESELKLFYGNRS
ncbi:hypothetical protein [Acinetobacter baumannii]|uniref:hypothetical protein n=1 Tax=Acinetobacter baumannii TaxID=470 RepID=UPI0011289700|nr:hypothetical protein [Acinetobacter baumannii]TPT86048.1 hypothetical protein FJU52_06425 [Acinetobacter baumannii]